MPQIPSNSVDIKFHLDLKIFKLWKFLNWPRELLAKLYRKPDSGPVYMLELKAEGASTSLALIISCHLTVNVFLIIRLLSLISQH